MASSDVIHVSFIGEPSSNQPIARSGALAPTEGRAPSMLLNRIQAGEQAEEVASPSAHSEARYRLAGLGEHGISTLNKMTSCFKPLFFNLRGCMRSMHDWTVTSSIPPQANDNWEISIDARRNKLERIGSGVEGIVYRGQLNGQAVACKCVKTREHTNVKHLSRLKHDNIIRFIGKSVLSDDRSTLSFVSLSVI